MQGNSVQPIPFAYGGSVPVAEGGGLYVAYGATVTLKSDTVESNSSPMSRGYGGGLYIASGATVYLDSFTVAHTINNTAGFDPNIDGTYILQNP